MTEMDRTQREFDVVVFGATSFVGQLVAARIDERHGELLAGLARPLRWAIAGRDAHRLGQLAGELSSGPSVVVADALRPKDVRSLVRRTGLIISTVGPYARYGDHLIQAVAAEGTDYLDLCGEPQWIAAKVREQHESAFISGARVVHACGFDSIPSDVGVLLLQRAAMERHGRPCVEVHLRVRELRGGVSGGTVASGLTVLEQARSDRQARRDLANPFCLQPAGSPVGAAQSTVRIPVRDQDGRWQAPFVMSAANERIVHRTHALLGFPWGSSFRYRESMDVGTGVGGAARAGAVAAALGLSVGAAVLPGARQLVRRFVPQPGEGPSPESQAAGRWQLELTGWVEGGAQVRGRLRGEGDPGYRSTAAMLVECAAEVLAVPRDVRPGGSWTPATVVQPDRAEDMLRRAGVTWVLESSPTT